jgi:hypothetical protein
MWFENAISPSLALVYSHCVLLPKFSPILDLFYSLTSYFLFFFPFLPFSFPFPVLRSQKYLFRL